MNKIFVISGPSGSGKTSIVKTIKKRFPNIYYSVSATTRKKRKMEKNGKDYIFLTHKQFEEYIKEGEFLEYARVFDEYYGTLKSSITNAIGKNKDIIIDVDVKGAKNIKRFYPNAVMIFILSPDIDTLKRRLEKRETEGRKKIALRLKIAKKEFEFLPLYNYIILNEHLKDAIEDMASIIEFEKSRYK